VIRRLHAKNYGCLKDVVTPELTPLHAFIGPNDSGKSTLLKAVALCGVAVSDLDTRDPKQLREESRSLLGPFGDPISILSRVRQSDPSRLQSEPIGSIVLETPHADSFLFEAVAGGYRQEFLREDSPTAPRLREERNFDLSYRLHADENAAAFVLGSQFLAIRIRDALRSSLLRFDPDALRRPSTLIPGVVNFSSDRGVGLPGVIDSIKNRDDDSFPRLSSEFKSKFPTVRELRLKVSTPSTKALEVILQDGTAVSPEAMSEGMLYYLGFLALQYLEPRSILLLEEPENGLHPSRIADVVRVLRAITERGTQVLMATHSPLVINELQPEEVTLVTRHSERGTRLTLLRDTPHFEERSKVYALGELWLSYADGVDEAPLLSET